MNEIVTVLRPEEVELAAGAQEVKSTFVGHARVEEVLFGGAVERLRVRMLDGGTLASAVQRADAPTNGTLIEVTRTLPEKRLLPVAPASASRSHAGVLRVLPTPGSSVSADRDHRRTARA